MDVLTNFFFHLAPSAFREGREISGDGRDGSVTLGSLYAPFPSSFGGRGNLVVVTVVKL